MRCEAENAWADEWVGSVALPLAPALPLALAEADRTQETEG